MDFLDELRTFERIAHAGSLSAASRALRVSPAGVSKRLTDLEARMGVRLFHRSTRGLALTEEGTAVLAQARSLLDCAEALETKFSDQAERISGLLRVSAPSRFGERYVVPAVQSFLTNHPSAEISLHLTDRHQDLITEGLDLTVRVGSSPDSSYIVRKLAISRRIVCASPDYLARRGRPSRPEELEDHDCLVLEDKDLWRFRHDGRERRVRVRPRVRSRDSDVVSELCRRGLGIALKSLWDVYEDIAVGRLVTLMSEYEVEDEGMICILLPCRNFVPPKVRAFITCLRDSIGDPPVWQQALERPTLG